MGWLKMCLNNWKAGSNQNATFTGKTSSPKIADFDIWLYAHLLFPFTEWIWKKNIVYKTCKK